ncbi:MAG: histidine kinase [Paucibacter sp.]|nr:histidine kinase [Roseateles sp.]
MRAHGTSDLLDVCHVGVVLRVLLGVQGLLALVLLLNTRDAQAWMQAVALDTVVTLPATLTWLLLACGLKSVLARSSPAGQAVFLCSLGAACALFSGELLVALMGADPAGLWRQLSLALAGAVGAGAVLAWLRLRARQQMSADALAKLVELQARIRPHFLLNTLNSAIALVQEDPKRAQRLLEDLSELYRAVIEDQGAVVSLAQEIELARRYLEIERVRFGERMRVSWVLDSEAGAARVPPLLLQPLVENAVRHGVEPNDDGGSVEIRTRCKGGEVEILVSNSVRAPRRFAGDGLTLDNVRRRLMLRHDVAARFELHPGKHRFSVRIMVPL